MAKEPDTSMLDFTQEHLLHLLGDGEGLDKSKFQRVYFDATSDVAHNTILKFVGLCPDGHRDVSGVNRPGSTNQDNFDASISYLSDAARALLHEIQTKSGQTSYIFKNHLGEDHVKQYRNTKLYPWDREELINPKRIGQKRARKR